VYIVGIPQYVNTEQIHEALADRTDMYIQWTNNS